MVLYCQIWWTPALCLISKKWRGLLHQRAVASAFAQGCLVQGDCIFCSPKANLCLEEMFLTNSHRSICWALRQQYLTCSWKICLKLFHSFQKFSTGRKPSLSMLFTPACLARMLWHPISLCPKTFLWQWFVGTTCTWNLDFNIKVSWIYQQPSNFSLNHCNDSKHSKQNLCFELH